MKISTLIRILEAFQVQYGDIEVWMESANDDSPFPMQGVLIAIPKDSGVAGPPEVAVIR